MNTETNTEATPDTRTRIVRAASLLMQRQGYDGTGIKQIAQEARATLGSVYHFFPGGKQELAVAAIHHGDQEFFEVLRDALEREEDTARAIADLCHELADGLHASRWVDGCPITTTSLGTAGRAPDIQTAAAQAFARWRGLVHDRLRASGMSESDAHDLAHTVISTLEGAELAAQVAQSKEPLQIAGKHLARLIALHQ
ncbi:TetR/AcrR family transcriptional regulator [Streptomyces sp. 71268]|uniref:TetR/AcrR family transcriptional regulator n=1 Tax=Streptomyces sp. 71268 TaxID=3002640 RepID=UPI0023F63892|nr:TetR/AcrR family transcriptional regulator [Streptomyces sp. 71268]WEV23772.1 TetR/AcrR family transcriptional regulator [Streptomyces sp. 71268]